MRKKNAYRAQAKHLRALLRSAYRGGGMLDHALVDKLQLISTLMEVDGAISLQSLHRLADAPFKEWDALATQLFDSKTFFTHYTLQARSLRRKNKPEHTHVTEATAFWNAFIGESS